MRTTELPGPLGRGLPAGVPRRGGARPRRHPRPRSWSRPTSLLRPRRLGTPPSGIQALAGSSVSTC
ncbi:hypothetical protein HBB16_11205 [Pseudonocardia sp. MCCB 268]|nr:hypothetical protein [Pseudonocardia cytotoxica]